MNQLLKRIRKNKKRRKKRKLIKITLIQKLISHQWNKFRITLIQKLINHQKKRNEQLLEKKATKISRDRMRSEVQIKTIVFVLHLLFQARNVDFLIYLKNSAVFS